jgi:EAL domain-containing protein (putative c-di-GMP-specific phosphodiesterase class I)
MFMSHGNILIIDDDKSICEFLNAIGEACGYIVTAVQDLIEFDKAYLAVKPRIIIIDLNLGKNDGIEILRKLASVLCRSKIILISSSDEKVLQSTLFLGQSENLDIIAAIQKPISPNDLRTLLLSISNESIEINYDSIIEAIMGNNYILYYEPKISIATGKLLGVEALIRWQPPSHNIIQPDLFIAVAEESDAIQQLSKWVNHEAIKQCSLWKKEGLNLTVSINLSVKILNDLMLPNALEELVQAYNIEPQNICLEITETIAMKNIVSIMDVLTRFRIKGFSVSIDDFGTAYSSLVELQLTPCNEIKIDKSFITNLKLGGPNYIIVRAIINLGHDFGLRVVAEGVETLLTLNLLKDLGCDVAQGFYFAKPMPPSVFSSWLKDHIDENLIFKPRKHS